MRFPARISTSLKMIVITAAAALAGSSSQARVSGESHRRTGNGRSGEYIYDKALDGGRRLRAEANHGQKKERKDKEGFGIHCQKPTRAESPLQLHGNNSVGVRIL